MPSSSSQTLLTPTTVATYVQTRSQFFPQSHGLAFTDPTELTVAEILGGNLNYTYQVTNAKLNRSIFVKQSPPYVKCLGPESPLTCERMEIEVSAYKEWSVGEFLPGVLDFNSRDKIVIMEFLEGYLMLEDVLLASNDGITDLENIAKGVGSFLGTVHSKTHTSNIPENESARLKAFFENRDLRDIQILYVFTLPYKTVGVLGDSVEYMDGVAECIKKYNGEDGNLVLCHGDLHAGSVMIKPSTASATATEEEGRLKVKIIDSEFAIYGPPGIDLGVLISGVMLTAMHLKYSLKLLNGGNGIIEELKKFATTLWNTYNASFDNLGGVINADTILTDAISFASCEVARTALGFAGGRLFLQFEDEAMKKEAVERTVLLARDLMIGRNKGIAGVGEFFEGCKASF